MKKKQWTDNLVEAVQASLGNMDLGAMQPFDHLQFEPLFAEQIIERLRTLIYEAKKQKIEKKEMAFLWPTLGSLRCFLGQFLLLNLKSAHILKNERKEITQFFFEMIQARAVADIYGRKSNICQTNEQIKNLLQRVTFQKGTPTIAKALGRLYNGCYNLSAGTYFDFYLDYCAENEGPYDVSLLYGSGHILVIKKFIDLQTPVWQELKTPYNSLWIYAIYKNVTFSCDMISVHSVYQGDTINNLVSYAVVADGKIMNQENDIKEAAEIFSMLSVEQWQRLTSVSVDEQKQKALLVKWYGMRKMFERLKLDWKPDTTMLKAVKQPFKDNSYWKIPEKNKDAYWRKLLDPTIDFYP